MLKKFRHSYVFLSLILYKKVLARFMNCNFFLQFFFLNKLLVFLFKYNPDLSQKKKKKTKLYNKKKFRRKLIKFKLDSVGNIFNE